MLISRRFLLSGIGALWAGAALGEAPEVSLRPKARPVRGAVAVRPAAAIVVKPAAEILAEAKLGGQVSYAVADLAGGMLEERDADALMAPASTAKIVTALYALAHLGAGYRFQTRLLATGPVVAGRVQGDLVLAGGGDPRLTSDDLVLLAQRLAARGVTGATGRLLVWGGALPEVERLNDEQPEQVAYNPALGGLNLNFNTVHFAWARQGADYALTMDARTDLVQPRAYTITARTHAEALPIYRYLGGVPEVWSVSRGALGKAGSRALPVRHPALYAGDVFQTLARAQGLELRSVEQVAVLPQGEVLAEIESPPLLEICKDMLENSTNLTAQVVGLQASLKQGITGHEASAAAMTAWVRREAGITLSEFHDHSGLSPTTRMSAREMVSVLAGPGRAMGLRGLLRTVKFLDSKGRTLPDPAQRAEAKTGTLNFVSCLAGYETAQDGRELVFATFAGDLPRRAKIAMPDRELPEGMAAWIRRARKLHLQLLERWGGAFPSATQ